MSSNNKLAATFHPRPTYQCAGCNRTIIIPLAGISKCVCGVRHHPTPIQRGRET